MSIRHDSLTVEWVGYATVRIEAAGTVIYLDPGRYGVLSGEWHPETPGVGHPPSRDRRPEDGDVICVSHVHHYDPDGIERVASEDATVVAFEGISVRDTGRDVARVSELPYRVRTVGMEADLAVESVPIWTVPAYNEPDGPHTRADGTPYHPRGVGCGFVLVVDGTRVFWPGDTDVLDGHAELDVSLFLPPIGGTFTMDRHEAAELAAALDPDLVVPIHYNTFGALETDAREFAADVAQSGVPVVLDEQE
jgi:L-ascorbate metabolism protein UlaG (beta-lactamase superfamily)